jgi:DNA repair exonuclease SbcCD ATPase subunit
LATCNESLHVQNVSQEDLDRLLGVQEGVSTLVQRLHVCGHVHCAESKAEIERLQAELIEYKNRVNFRNGVLAHTSKENRDNSATIATQQALLIALVECKDALLAELKSQRASYPAKVTDAMVNAGSRAIQSRFDRAGYKPLDAPFWPGTVVVAQDVLRAALAAAPKDDRDELTRLLEAHRGHATEKVKQAEAERNELKRQLEQVKAQGLGYLTDLVELQAKCPPDDVLAAWHKTARQIGNIALLQDAVVKTAAWQASKTAHLWRKKRNELERHSSWRHTFYQYPA